VSTGHIASNRQKLYFALTVLGSQFCSNRLLQAGVALLSSSSHLPSSSLPSQEGYNSSQLTTLALSQLTFRNLGH